MLNHMHMWAGGWAGRWLIGQVWINRPSCGTQQVFDMHGPNAFQHSITLHTFCISRFDVTTPFRVFNVTCVIVSLTLF